MKRILVFVTLAVVALALVGCWPTDTDNDYDRAGWDLPYTIGYPIYTQGIGGYRVVDADGYVTGYVGTVDSLEWHIVPVDKGVTRSREDSLSYVTDFSATRTDDGVRLTWLGHEFDNVLGYFVFMNHQEEPLNDEVIYASHAMHPINYVLNVDGHLSSVYYLKMVSFTGDTLAVYGPVSPSGNTNPIWPEIDVKDEELGAWPTPGSLVHVHADTVAGCSISAVLINQRGEVAHDFGQIRYGSAVIDNSALDLPEGVYRLFFSYMRDGSQAYYSYGDIYLAE